MKNPYFVAVIAVVTLVGATASIAQPRFTPIPTSTLLSGSPLHLALEGIDPSGQALTYTAVVSDPLVSASVLSGNRSLRIQVQTYGTMVFQLFDGRARRVTDRITSLADSGFYNGLIFHRILNDFVIQGGDPTGTGAGGSNLGNFNDQFHVDLQHNRTGVLSFANNLPGWDHDVNVAESLSERCGGRRVAVDNDVNVGTLAEVRLGSGVGFDNVLGIFMGTGVGAGLVLDGKLRQGPRGIAGELGHMYVAFDSFDGDRDGVGRGEVEDYAGRRMMETRARARHAEGEQTALIDLVGDGRMKSSTWEKALEADDAMARSIIDDATEVVATAVASAIALVDIELVVLGGGMAERLGETFRIDLETRVAQRAFTGAAAPVVAAALGDVSGALGAALLVEDLA
jgi:predicted NBD/HSP70 family sugar kinase